MEYRSEADREKASVALSSIAGAVVITGLKLVVGLSTGSLGILSEALHSGLDLLAAAVTFIAVRVSSRPADRSHMFGHGKVENISALLETVLLLVTCYWIIQEAIDRLTGKPIHVEVTFWSFFVIVASIAVDYSRSRALAAAARKHRSQALEADALHFSTDIWSSAVVLLGLILTLLQVPVADSVAALVVALIVIGVSLSLGRRTIDELLDRAPRDADSRILELAKQVPGVVDVDQIRVRTSGPRLFVDFRLGIRRTTPFELADALVHQVEEAVQKAFPQADIVIHPDPVPTDDESVASQVQLLLARQRLTAHDLRVFRLNGKYQIELHLEFGQDKEFEQVHALVDTIETMIMEEIPQAGGVVVHIEDAGDDVMDSVDVTPWAGALVERVQRLALGERHVQQCAVPLVLDVKGSYYVSVNIVVDRELSLEEVHALSTALESRIMVEAPQVKEVHIHAEPAGV